jgi:glycosyltransferase involved in cell wall biosynthesis
MHRTVSIVIDNYNYARFLRQAIDSALAQTYPHVEVVVVDDGSTDASRDVIRSYGDRIRPVLKENGGQASAFNAGFAVAKGEIVALLDADDYLAPHAAERIAAAWSDEVKILHHRLREVDAEGRDLGFNPPLGEPLDAGDVVPVLLRKGFYGVPPTSGLAYSRELLRQVLPMPEADFRICADTYLFLVTPFRAPVTALDETLACYRLHGANAHREAGLRRNWRRQKLEVAQRYGEIRRALIQKLAAEHGRPAPDPEQWIDSAQLFERLLLLRGSSAPRAGLGELAAAVRKKAWSEPGLPFPSRLRVAVLSLILCHAPRAFLCRIYPNIFLR